MILLTSEQCIPLALLSEFIRTAHQLCRVLTLLWPNSHMWQQTHRMVLCLLTWQEQFGGVPAESLSAPCSCHSAETAPGWFTPAKGYIRKGAVEKTHEGQSARTWHFLISIKLDNYSTHVLALESSLKIRWGFGPDSFSSWFRCETRLTMPEMSSVMDGSSEWTTKIRIMFWLCNSHGDSCSLPSPPPYTSNVI